MGITQDKNLEALRREFEENRARVWEDERIPLGEKQAEVDRLWREFDSQRRAIQDGIFQSGTGVVEAGEASRRSPLFVHQRRPYWK
jgi:hypothetical protein